MCSVACLNLQARAESSRGSCLRFYRICAENAERADTCILVGLITFFFFLTVFYFGDFLPSPGVLEQNYRGRRGITLYVSTHSLQVV